MNLNIFELKEISEDELFGLAQQTIDTFPILEKIYDRNFLNDLVRRRYHFDNYLLWLLVSKEQFTYSTWSLIAKCLQLLEDSDGISHFTAKLRSRTDRVFKSYQIELEYAAYYKKKGYAVELEPEIPDTKKNPEFKIESLEGRVFFEVKSIFWEEIMKEENLEIQIQGAIGRIELPFVFNIRHKPGLSIEHISDLKKFLIKELNGIDREDFPITLFYPNKENTLVEIAVLGKPNKLSYGYLGAISGGVKWGIGAESLRKKISKKVSQLPKGEANVLVIEKGSWLLGEIDVNYALFGDERLRFYKDGSVEPFRDINGMLTPTKNTRLSAIIFSQNKWERQDFSHKKSVFHNPFAYRPLDEKFFEDANVKQFLPTFEEKGIRMTWR